MFETSWHRLLGLGRGSVVAGPRWSGSSSAISRNSPASILVTSLGGGPAPMQRSASLWVPPGDNPVPLPIMCDVATVV